MPKAENYRITKIEKGPLQRFKNQNLLLKKFGEIGLQVYKAITGKRTSTELRSDLDVEPEIFLKILLYMKEAGMVELTPLEAEGSAIPEEAKEAPAKEEEWPIREEEPAEAKMVSGKKESEETPAESEEAEAGKEESITFEEIKPVEEEEGLETERHRLQKKKQKEREDEEEAGASKESESGTEEEGKKEAATEEPEEELRYEEIKPIEEEDETKHSEEEEAPLAKEKKGEAKNPEEEREEESAKPEEETERGKEREEEPAAEPEKLAPEEEAAPVEEELTPVERIIKEKYGEVGLKVYTLIDGRRTAEQIMKETGLTEAKLVEILDFMDEQGIIKLEYPKEKKPEEKALPASMEKEEFAPMVGQEEEEELLKATLDLPVKAPLDFVKGMQLKTGIRLKHGDKGSKLFDQIDGKRDVIDLALAVNIPLYTVDTLLKFFLQQHAILLKSLTREEVKKKYGDDGYSVYKRYGKDGLMLYELIGKEMTIQQMANMVTQDKEKVVEMFLFIHKVLGIDLPIDKEVLYRQLGIG